MKVLGTSPWLTRPAGDFTINYKGCGSIVLGSKQLTTNAQPCPPAQRTEALGTAERGKGKESAEGRELRPTLHRPPQLRPQCLQQGRGAGALLSACRSASSSRPLGQRLLGNPPRPPAAMLSRAA